jgi:hypothetical protein
LTPIEADFQGLNNRRFGPFWPPAKPKDGGARLLARHSPCPP